MIALILIVLIVFNSAVFLSHCQDDSQDTLQLTVAVFRHGERTVEYNSTYPNDPYLYETYFPFGNAELINKGKRTMYTLGKTLKSMYSSFLGSMYLPGLIDVTTTRTTRSTCSVQLLLAGLFPPKTTLLEWNKDLNWNPIPYSYIKEKLGFTSAFSLNECPSFKMVYEAFLQTPEALAIQSRYTSSYDYLTQVTGLPISDISDLAHLFSSLQLEEEFGLQLPKWTKSVFPTYLRNAGIDYYILLTGTPHLNRLFGGNLLKKTINDMQKRINGTKNPLMYIYSDHDMGVVGALAAMKLYYRHTPKFGACVITELHKIGEEHFVKVRYNKNRVDKFEDMKIPGCNVMCPFEDFVNLVWENIPTNEDVCELDETSK